MAGVAPKRRRTRRHRQTSHPRTLREGERQHLLLELVLIVVVLRRRRCPRAVPRGARVPGWWRLNTRCSRWCRAWPLACSAHRGAGYILEGALRTHPRHSRGSGGGRCGRAMGVVRPCHLHRWRTQPRRQGHVDLHSRSVAGRHHAVELRAIGGRHAELTARNTPLRNYHA